MHNTPATIETIQETLKTVAVLGSCAKDLAIGVATETIGNVIALPGEKSGGDSFVWDATAFVVGASGVVVDETRDRRITRHARSGHDACLELLDMTSLAGRAPRNLIMKNGTAVTELELPPVSTKTETTYTIHRSDSSKRDAVQTLEITVPHPLGQYGHVPIHAKSRLDGPYYGSTAMEPAPLQGRELLRVTKLFQRVAQRGVSVTSPSSLA